MRVLGAVLAGGRSSRFGSDKAAVLIEGKPMLDWVIDALAPQVDDILVCGRESPDHQCVPDRPAAGLGPLGGLNAALRYAAANGFGAVLSVPCDTPRLPADLRQQLGEPEDGVIVQGLPVIGLWPARLAAVLDDFVVHTESRAMGAWAVHIGARRVALRELPANVNTPGDLERLTGGKIVE
jgi:molybdopterin-guanine dinucleotide biosynthesis protein A